MEPESRILCVDIGGTRIKAAVLPRNTSRGDVERAPVGAIPALGWLNDSLPQLLTAENVAHLLRRGRIEPGHDAICVAVPGPVSEGRYFHRTDLLKRGVPKDLKSAFEQHADPLPVSLIKDADAWAAGVIRYAELFGMPLEYPFLALTFGTGVGISAAMSPGSIVSLEITATAPGMWEPLEKESSHPIAESWQVHKILGREFFEWVATENCDWWLERIRQEFTKRVIVFVRAAREHLGRDPGVFRTLVIGGGNAEYIVAEDLAGDAGLDVRLLLPPVLAVNPDIIPLLGLSHHRDRVVIAKGPW
ncbi:MAG: hypothetical protein ACYS0G_08810 [Planctomycetota bacterium]